MTASIIAKDLDSAKLTEQPLQLPAAEPLSGEILVRSTVLYHNSDKSIVTGVWESDIGRSRWSFRSHGEVVQIISGRMIVVEDGGAPVALGPGSTAVFPIGWEGVWTVEEPLRKVFVVFKNP